MLPDQVVFSYNLLALTFCRCSELLSLARLFLERRYVPRTENQVPRRGQGRWVFSFLWVSQEGWDGEWTLGQGAMALLGDGGWMASYTISLLPFSPRSFTREGFLLAWKAQSVPPSL